MLVGTVPRASRAGKFPTISALAFVGVAYHHVALVRAQGLVVAVMVQLALAPFDALAEGRGTFIHTPPTEFSIGTPLKLEGTLVGGSISRIVARVRNGPGEWDEVDLDLQYGDLYRGTIPGSRLLPPFLEYYIEGITTDGDRVALFSSASSPVRLKLSTDSGASTVDNPYGDKPEKVEKPPLAPADNPKCKKKKGKKLPKECEEPPPVKKEPEPVEPPPKPEKVTKAVEKPADKPVEPRPTKPPETVAERPAKEAPAREPPAGPPRKKSVLDEDLAVYGAEVTAGVVQRVGDRERVSAQSPTILTHDQLRSMGVRYVYEALDLVPGLTVSRDVQGFYRVAARGLRADAEVMFTLNGQRLNTVYDGKALANLPIDSLARIEIFRGPATADVGLGNVTALINLITNREEGLRVSASGGLYEAFDGHVSAAKAFGALKLFADGDVVSQYGDRRPVVRDGLEATAPRPKTTSDQRFLINAGLGATYDNPDLGVLSANARFLLENRSALLGLFDVVGPSSRLQWQVLQVGLGWTRPLGEGHRLAVRAWFDLQSTTRLWQLSPNGYQVRAADLATVFPDGVREQISFATRAIGAEGRLDLALPAKNHLVATLSAEQQSLSSFGYLTNYVTDTFVSAGTLARPEGLAYPTENKGGTGRGPAADRFNLGLSVADTWPIVDVLSIQAGLRFDLTQLPRADASGFLGPGFTPSIGPRIGLVITPVSSLSLRAFYGRSFRAPTMQELAESIPNSDASQGRTIGNPQLQGANLDSVEVGFDYVQGIGDGRLKLRGQGFFERMGNAIGSVDATGNLVPYTNRPLGVQSVGLEGEARLELTPRITVWLNSSWVRVEDLGTPSASRLLTDVPQLRFNAGFSFPIGSWLAFDVIARYASERRNNSRTALELLRKYTLPSNASFAAQLRTELLFDHLVLSVLGQNVFNLETADDAFRPDRVTGGVPREGAAVFGLARVVFQ